MENGANEFATRFELLPTAYNAELVKGDIRTSNSDFRVKEVLAFEPSGEGEHLFLQLEKNGCNTDWVIKQVQKTFGLSSREVGYAGKKDRNSISEQWFSLHLPGKEVQPSLIESPSITVKNAVRHNKKLRVGSIKENQFEIVVRNLSSKLDQKALEQIVLRGFPNYFGTQRFGKEFGNLEKANQLLVEGKKIKNRNLKGLVLSSARSYLFNLQLAKRIEADNWTKVIPGDCINLDNSQSYYHLDKPTNEEQLRIDQADTHICGWLAGKQPSEATTEALAFELEAIKGFQPWLLGLNRFNLDSQRRSYRAFAKNLKVTEQGNTASLSFSLGRGCFATSLLKELVMCNDASTNLVSSEISSSHSEALS